MTTFTIYLFNNKDMQVDLELSIRKMQLVEFVFKKKTDLEKQKFLQDLMEGDFYEVYDESFETLKKDYENCIDEIIDLYAGGSCARDFYNDQKDFGYYEEVNSLLTTGVFLAHKQ